MTPTLLGRWQTRLLLLIVFGVPISLLFGVLYRDLRTPLVLLGYVIVFGLAWDVLYNLLQGFRWDQDWPPAFQLAAGVWEGLFVWLLVAFLGLPGVASELGFGQFVLHYGTVWFISFVTSQSLLRLVFPRWRFRGGQWL